MSTIRFISGRAALENFIHGYSDEAQRELEARNINATGALSKSHRVEVVEGEALCLDPDSFPE